MLTLPKNSHTDFENALRYLNTFNVRFRLYLSLLSGESGPCDLNVFDTLLEELINDYDGIYSDLKMVFDSLESVRPDFVKVPLELES